MKATAAQRTIELSDLQPHFIDRAVISASQVYGAELGFEQGKNYLIQAPSGKGKSTLLNILYGIESRYNGRVKGNANARQCFSYVLQDLRLFPELSAFDNLQIKNQLSDQRSEQDLKTLLERAGLREQRDQLAGELSFGQRQRVAILRALCMPFDFLFLDEPFSHLDAESAQQISALVQEELSVQNAGLIVAVLDHSDHFNYDKELLL